MDRRAIPSGRHRRPVERHRTRLGTILGVRAYAEANGLGDEIIAEWETSIPGLAERADGTASRIGRKAWRFEGEMAEIAAAMEQAGLPGGFHDAVREIYRRLSDLKDLEAQSVEVVNRRLLGP